MKKILLTIGVLLLINVLIMPLISNFNLGMVLLGIIAALIILYSIYFDKIPKGGHAVVIALCLIPLFFITFLAIYGNSDNVNYDEDVVIVLGAGIHGEQVSLPLARRLDKAAEYYEKNPLSYIVVCGGQGFQEDIPEALAMERYLIAKGVPQNHIIKEDKSTSTYENLVFARELLGDRFPDGFIGVVITNDFHVYRATKLAQYAGIDARHIGARTEWYTLPVSYLREMFAVAKMWVLPPK